MTPQQIATMLLLDWQSERDRRHAKDRRQDREYAEVLDVTRREMAEPAKVEG